MVAPEGQGPLFALAFGVAYAVASLGCTLPIFLVVAALFLIAAGAYLIAYWLRYGSAFV
ncbi:MAG TPA: hypothetical protein VNL95_08700 [Dehalococcoidia bacterium]|nr:hypothetical protein [Dehalococcoidia bacterium]